MKAIKKSLLLLPMMGLFLCTLAFGYFPMDLRYPGLYEEKELRGSILIREEGPENVDLSELEYLVFYKEGGSVASRVNLKEGTYSVRVRSLPDDLEVNELVQDVHITRDNPYPELRFVYSKKKPMHLVVSANLAGYPSEKISFLAKAKDGKTYALKQDPYIPWWWVAELPKGRYEIILGDLDKGWVCFPKSNTVEVKKDYGTILEYAFSQEKAKIKPELSFVDGVEPKSFSFTLKNALGASQKGTSFTELPAMGEYELWVNSLPKGWYATPSYVRILPERTPDATPKITIGKQTKDTFGRISAKSYFLGTKSRKIDYEVKTPSGEVQDPSSLVFGTYRVQPKNPPKDLYYEPEHVLVSFSHTNPTSQITFVWQSFSDLSKKGVVEVSLVSRMKDFDGKMTFEIRDAKGKVQTMNYDFVNNHRIELDYGVYEIRPLTKDGEFSHPKVQELRVDKPTEYVEFLLNAQD